MRKFLLALIACLVAVIAYASPGSPYLSYGKRYAGGGGGSTATFDAKSGANSNATVASLSWTHTPVGTPTDVYVAVANLVSTVSVSVTYGGTSMGTAVVSQTSVGTGTTCHIFALANPASGAQTVVVSFSPNDSGAAEAITITGGNTTTATDFSASGNNGGSTATSINTSTTTATNDLVIDGATNDTNSAVTGWTKGASQTLAATRTFNTSVDFFTTTYITATGASQAMSETLTPGATSDNIAQCVVSAKHG